MQVTKMDAELHGRRIIWTAEAGFGHTVRVTFRNGFTQVFDDLDAEKAESIVRDFS